MLNQQIQNYKILSPLGQGGMATVYLAEHNLLGNKSAFKLLNKEYVHNENIRKRFLAEARSMARMTHPNIIKVTDLIDDGEMVAFVMEYVEGESLKEYIDRKGKLSDEEINMLFSQMLKAVGYVHEQNLVHRDIKPSNFMVDPNGEVKLMDFGIAKNTDANAAEYTQTGTGMQMGTPMYMSPEQVRNTKEVTNSSDIYSLGVVLWQMVTGTKPYDTKTLSSFDLQIKIVTEKLPLTNTFWDGMIEKATQKEVGNRFLDCAGFSDDIKGISNKETIKPEQDSFESTIIEKATPKEKEDRIPKKEEEIKVTKTPITENITTKKRKLLIPLLVSVICLIVLIFYFSKDKVDDKNQELSTKDKADDKNQDVFTNVTDIDGNKYETVVIGKQTWMKENLNVSRFRNGDIIPEVKSSEEWIKAGEMKQPAWCYYENNAENGKKYGKLYNWYAVIDARGLAPDGWHIPSDIEWKELSDYLGGEENAGFRLKSKNGWPDGGNGSNSSGFSGLSGGCRFVDGEFLDISVKGLLWSCTEDDAGTAWHRSLTCSNGYVYFLYRLDIYKNFGLSVRCLRD